MSKDRERGLYGCSSKGVLHTPSGRFFTWLPPFLAFRLHSFLNKKYRKY